MKQETPFLQEVKKTTTFEEERKRKDEEGKTLEKEAKKTFEAIRKLI